MADQFTRAYDVERIGGDQRTRMAELLRSNMFNQPQGQMISGWYVAPSWSQQLAPAISGITGAYMGKQAEEERKQKTADILRQLSEGAPVEQKQPIQNFNRIEQSTEQTPISQQEPQNALQRLTQRPQQSTEQSQMNPAMAPAQPQAQFRPLTEEEKIGKVMELAQYNPYAAQIWSAQDTARQNRLMKLEDEKSRREWQAEQNQLNREGRMDYARLAAGLAAGNRVPASEKPLTEFQGKSMTFGTRAAEADKILSNTQFNPVSVEAVRKTGIVGNLFADPSTQKALQAQRDFVNAVLRQESGAAISQGEFENAQKQYFPQPGDSPEVIAQKAKNRQTQIMGFARQAGPNGGRDVVQIMQTPYAIPQTQQTTAPQGRLGGMTPPNTKVKFLGFE